MASEIDVILDTNLAHCSSSCTPGMGFTFLEVQLIISTEKWAYSYPCLTAVRTAAALLHILQFLFTAP